MKHGACLLLFFCFLANLLLGQSPMAVGDGQSHSIAAIWPEVQAALDSFQYGTAESRLRLRRGDPTHWGRAEWAIYAQLRGEIAYQFMETDSASRYLNQAKAAIAEDPALAFLKGRNLGTLGKLHLVLGRQRLARQYFQAALTVAGTYQLGRARAHQQLSFYFRTGLEVDRGLEQARQALRALQLAETQSGYAQISPLYTQQLYADICKEIAAIYTKLATGSVNAPAFLLPGEHLTDSAGKYLALANRHWSTTDSIGRTHLHTVLAGYYLNQPKPADKERGLRYVDSIFMASHSYPGRILYAEIVANDLLSAYYLNSRIPNKTSLGVEASERALYLRQRRFGLTSPELVVPIYMRVVHRYMELDRNPNLRTPEHYDKLLEELLEATQLVAPAFDCHYRDDYPDPEQVIQQDYYLSLLAVRIHCFHMRYRCSSDPEDLQSGWKLVLSSIDIMGKELGQSGSAYRLDYLMKKLNGFTEPALLIAAALHKENPMGPYWEQALRITELDKSMQLRYQLLSRQGSRSLGISQVLRDRLAEAASEQQMLTADLRIARTSLNLEEINRISSSLFAANARFDSALQEMRQFSSAYDQSFQAARFLTRSEIRKDLLAPDQALVIFQPLSRTGFALVLTPDSVYFLETKSGLNPLLKEIEILQQELRGFQADSLHQPDSLAYPQAMAALYDQIWKPIEAACDSLPRRMLVIPHSSMEALPLGQLLTLLPLQAQHHAQWPYLGRQYAFSYAFSLESLRLLPRSPARTGNGRWLGFAPEFVQAADTPALSPALARRGGEKLSPLFANQEEVAEIGSLMGQTQYLLGASATKQALLAQVQEFEFVHLATHAGVTWQYPDSSFVACTATVAEGSDNLVRLSEIYQLGHAASMVVLSGCDTGIGQRQAGEGMISLARAFSAAGARSVVSSLWSVNDATTRDLMRDFYQFLCEGDPKDVALQKAEMRYLEVSNTTLLHPYYWASFRVIGDVSPVRFRVWWEATELWLLVAGVLVFLWILYSRRNLN